MTANEEEGCCVVDCGKPICRRLSGLDAEAVAELEKECFTLPWSAAQLRSAFQQSSFVAFGFFEAGNLFAYISLYHVVDEMEILNLAVRVSKRRLGYGKSLLRHTLRAGQKIGIHRIWLEVRRSNVAALSLYLSFGFRQKGIRSKYYPDTGEDALVLERVLEGADGTV